MSDEDPTLSQPTRRRIYDALAERKVLLSVSELAVLLSMRRGTISNHLGVLLARGLIQRESGKRGKYYVETKTPP